MPLWLKLCQHFDFTPFFSVVMSMAVKIYSVSSEERSPSAGVSAAAGHPEGAGEEMQMFPWAPGLFWGTETLNHVGYFQRSFNRTSFTCGARKLNACPRSGGVCTKLTWPGMSRMGSGLWGTWREWDPPQGSRCPNLGGRASAGHR